jgi:hypothetical protein
VSASAVDDGLTAAGMVHPAAKETAVNPAVKNDWRMSGDRRRDAISYSQYRSPANVIPSRVDRRLEQLNPAAEIRARHHQRRKKPDGVIAGRQRKQPK